MRNYKILHIIIITLLPFLLSNCEEVMEDFSVQKSDPQMVIEGICSSKNDSVYVYISKTADYLHPIEYSQVSGAEVVLEFGDTSITVPEIQAGVYAETYDFPEETLYTLTVTYDNISYTAESFMPKPVAIDSISSSVFPYSVYMATYPGELFYEVTFYFKDPFETQNFYRIKTYKNDTLFNGSSDIVVMKDKMFNGKAYQLLMRGYTFEVSDTVMIELISIDEANYTYYLTLEEAMTSTGNFSVPDNPITNFTPRILGHFNAFSVDSIQMIIP
ncbi:MAG: DUF4249 family protein [Bacteroidales bacterium]|jgi:hypothetical protein|nr:DUF4249 family protein [Bacteroidales bacterium]